MKTASDRGFSHISSFTHKIILDAKVSLKPKPSTYQFWLKIIKNNHKQTKTLQNRNLHFKLHQIFNQLKSFLLTLFRNSFKTADCFVITIEAVAEIIFGLSGTSVLIARVRLV
jgi:hypothetical protein